MRRSQILEAAAICFARNGFSRTTMDDVVRESGLSKGSLYRFFASKDEVLLSIFDEFEKHTLAVLEEDAEEASALERLNRCGQAAVGLLASQSELRNTWIDFFSLPASRKRLQEMYRHARRQLSRVIRQGIDSGEINSVDPAAVAAGILGTIEGLLLQAIVDSEFNPRPHWTGMWNLLETGLRRTEK